MYTQKSISLRGKGGLLLSGQISTIATLLFCTVRSVGKTGAEEGVLTRVTPGVGGWGAEGRGG